MKSYNYSKDYKQAYVKTWQDIDDSVDEVLLQETNVFLYEVLMKLGASSKIAQINMPFFEKKIKLPGYSINSVKH